MSRKPPTQCGQIFTPFGALPHEHEIAVARLLIQTGHDVRFLTARTTPTPDIIFRNRQWEIKSPIGKSSRTLENNLRSALHQSPHVILDLQRINLPEDQCLKYLTNHLGSFHGLKHLLVVTKTHQILNFHLKTACPTPLPMLQ